MHAVFQTRKRCVAQQADNQDRDVDLYHWSSAETGHSRDCAPSHAQLDPLQVTMARFYGIRAKETGQNLNECTRIVNELPRLN